MACLSLLIQTCFESIGKQLFSIIKFEMGIAFSYKIVFAQSEDWDQWWSESLLSAWRHFLVLWLRAECTDMQIDLSARIRRLIWFEDSDQSAYPFTLSSRKCYAPGYMLLERRHAKRAYLHRVSFLFKQEWFSVITMVAGLYHFVFSRCVFFFAAKRRNGTKTKQRHAKRSPTHPPPPQQTNKQKYKKKKTPKKTNK